MSKHARGAGTKGGNCLQLGRTIDSYTRVSPNLSITWGTMLQRLPITARTTGMTSSARPHLSSAVQEAPRADPWDVRVDHERNSAVLRSGRSSPDSSPSAGAAGDSRAQSPRPSSRAASAVAANSRRSSYVPVVRTDSYSSSRQL